MHPQCTEAKRGCGVFPRPSAPLTSLSSGFHSALAQGRKEGCRWIQEVSLEQKLWVMGLVKCSTWELDPGVRQPWIQILTLPSGMIISSKLLFLHLELNNIFMKGLAHSKDGKNTTYCYLCLSSSSIHSSGNPSLTRRGSLPPSLPLPTPGTVCLQHMISSPAVAWISVYTSLTRLNLPEDRKHSLHPS